MAVLYSRDYSNLTKEEIEEKAQLERENIDPNSKFSVNLYYDYSKAVRHNMSLFPNNFMDNADLQQNCDELISQCNGLEELLNGKITELDIKRYIQNNEYYHIPASIFKYYNFGHHAAYVFKEFRLGTSFSADYLLVGDSSDRHQFVFVEFVTVAIYLPTLIPASSAVTKVTLHSSSSTKLVKLTVGSCFSES